MSEIPTEKMRLYDATDSDVKDGTKRKLAVEAALEIIHAWALGNKAGSGDYLVQHMNDLAGYANLIQAALEIPKQQG